MPDSEGELEHAAVVIRESGSPATFDSRTHIYLHVDGMKYWTMGSPINETIVLNRAKS
jgi:hypothetical protein